MAETLVVNEIFLSVQGESTWAGVPCVFVRLTGCDLRCSYCDTAYAFNEGRRMSLEDVLAEVQKLGSQFEEQAGSVKLPIVELTGGEPLLQRNAPRLMTCLCDEGYTVLLETSGAHDISMVDARVRRIMDLKCPSSGESARNRWENIPLLTKRDEVKFVIGTHEDYAWARETVSKYNLASICPVLFSWVEPLTPGQQADTLKRVPAGQTPIARRELVEQILADGLPVRFQVQMHKVIWPKDARGV